MALSNSLSQKIDSDVRGSQEKAIETQVKNSLSEIKNKFKYTESYISTLYDSSFKSYLKLKTFNSPDKLPKEITILNNMKLQLIKQWLEAKKAAEQSPNLVTKWIYWICWISKDISKNNTTENFIKWVIDELMAIPDMLVQIVKDPIWFGKALYKLITNPKDLRNGLKQAYWDAFTQSLSTPEGAYRKWRSAMLIALSFLPWGAAKFWLNLTRWVRRTVVKKSSNISTKIWLKNSTKEVSKTIAKKTEQWLKNHKWSKIMHREMTWWARNYAQRQVEKNAVKITRETQAATKAGRVAEIPAKSQWILRKWFDKVKRWVVDKVVRFWDKLPVISQINRVSRWTFKKLDKWTEVVVKKLHPKFYEKLAKQESTLQRVKITAEKAAKNLNQQSVKVEKVAKDVSKQKAKIAEIERAIATKTGKKYNISHLNRAKNKLSQLEWKLKEARRAETRLKTSLKNANEKYLVHQSIIEWMNNAHRAGKLAVWIEAQQIVSVLDRAQIATLDREIEEAVSEIDESYDNVIGDAETAIEEVENLLQDYEWIAADLESWKTEFNEDNISIDLPEWVKLSDIDPNSYKITITGLASKTWSDAINNRIARQRAENAKQVLIRKYWIQDNWQIVLETDLQSNHPDKLNESLSQWQWARIKLEKIS